MIFGFHAVEFAMNRMHHHYSRKRKCIERVWGKYDSTRALQRLLNILN